MGQPIGSILELRFKGRVNGQIVQTSLHYSVAVVSSDAQGTEESDFLDQITFVGQTILPAYMACMATNYTLESVEAQFVAPTRFVAVIQAHNEAGSSPGGASDAQNLHASLIERTALAGKKYRAILKPPALPTSWALLGMLTQAALAGFITLASRLRVPVAPALGGGVYNPVIWHRKLLPGQNSTGITSIMVAPTVRTQYRRTIGVGK